VDKKRHDKLEELVGLALELHGTVDNHRAFTIQSMKDHAEEIRLLLKQKDEHWKAESTDLFIHCLLLLTAAGVGAGELEGLIDRRLERFREKITDAIRDRQHKAKFRKDIYEQEDPHH